MRLFMSMSKDFRSITSTLFLLIFLIPFTAHSQVYNQQHPTLSVTFDAQIITADVVYLGDLAFNLQNLVLSPQGPIVFFMTITSDQTTEIMFGIDVIAETEVAQDEVVIFSGITQPILLEANQPRYFTNRDIAKGGKLELYDSKLIDLDVPSPHAKKLIDAVQATSRLPDGDYYIYFTAYTPGITGEPDVEIKQIVRHLRVINPTRLELLSPMDNERIITPFPIFQWYSDTREVILRVYEMREGMHSPEEAITGIPHLEQRLSNTNQFIYPQTGANVRTLEQGKHYVWYIEALYRTSANRNEAIISELNKFVIIDPTKENVHNLIMFELKRLLEDKYQDILTQIEQGNFEITGDFTLDGSQIGDEELLNYLNAIRTGLNNAILRNAAIQQ